MKELIQVSFYDSIPEEQVKFAVIISRYHGKLLWVKHKKRDSREFPGGHREAGEMPERLTYPQIQPALMQRLLEWEKDNQKGNIVSWQ